MTKRRVFEVAKELNVSNKEVLDILKAEAMRDNAETDISAEKWEWISDMIQILLYYEIYKRRHYEKRGILRF